MNYSTQIQRDGHLLSRPPSSPKKRKRLKKVSDKRRLQGAIYRERRKVFLGENPTCQAWAILWPNDKTPPPRSTDVHHVAGRIGANYLDRTRWLAVSRRAHDEIHCNPSRARKLGLLV